VKGQEQREARAQKDADLIDEWVGSDIWGTMVLQAMRALAYIHAHRDDEGFFSKDVHQLANQCLLLIIFLNTFPGRCGGWELLKKDKVLEQLAREVQDNIIIHHDHKTKKFYGPLLKWAPKSLLEAFNMYSELPMRDSLYFVTSHTATDIVCSSHVLQCASKTFGHPGAIPNSNFVRKLFATVAASEDTIDPATWNRAVEDLAQLDAHSAQMARSIHYNLSDRIKGGVIKKSVRAYFATMKRMPLEFPIDTLSQDGFSTATTTLCITIIIVITAIAIITTISMIIIITTITITQDDFQSLLSSMGKRGFKRKAPEDDAGDAELDDAQPARPMERKRQLRSLIQIMLMNVLIELMLIVMIMIIVVVIIAIVVMIEGVGSSPWAPN
jgi:hypothetical protein